MSANRWWIVGGLLLCGCSTALGLDDLQFNGSGSSGTSGAGGHQGGPPPGDPVGPSEAQTGAWGIAVDDSYAYWTAGSAVWASPFTNRSVANPVASDSSYAPGRGIAVDAASAYWIDDSGNVRVVSKMPTGGQANVLHMSAAEHGRWIAIDTANVYWTAGCDPMMSACTTGFVGRVGKSSMTEVHLADFLDGPEGILSSGSKVSWATTNAGIISSVDAGCAAPCMPQSVPIPAEMSARAWAIALDDAAGTFYWGTEGTAGTIWAIDINTPGATPQRVSQETGSVNGIALDSSYVYWLRNFESPFRYEVRRRTRALGDSDEHVLAAGDGYAWAIAVEASNQGYAYWTLGGDADPTHAGVRRVQKPGGG